MRQCLQIYVISGGFEVLGPGAHVLGPGVLRLLGPGDQGSWVLGLDFRIWQVLS